MDSGRHREGEKQGRETNGCPRRQGEDDEGREDEGREHEGMEDEEREDEGREDDGKGERRERGPRDKPLETWYTIHVARRRHLSWLPKW